MRSRSSASSTYSSSVDRDALAGGGLVVVLGQLGAAADHLAQRPERDPLAVGRRAAAMPVDRLRDAVDVLLELPDQPALADAARAGDRDEARPPIAADGVELLLQLPQLLVAADERCLEGVGASVAAALRDDAERLPRRDGAGLALERVVADRLEDDRALGRARVASPTRTVPGLRHALQACRGVDEVAGHHALVGGAERDRRLAGQDARREPGGSGCRVADRVDQLERRADGALGVVLVGGRACPRRP